MTAIVNGVCLDSLADEIELYKLLDATEDFDERKKVRARLRQVQTELREQRDAMMKKREDDREDMIQQRQREAIEQKRRTLAMYDQMAKSSPAGGPKVMDINIYKNAESSPNNIIVQPTRDLVEEAIQERQKAAVDKKQRILAAYDAAARSGVAGPKTADFDAINNSVSAPVTPTQPPPSCTFGGIIPTSNNQQIKTPVTPTKPPPSCTYGGIIPTSNNQQIKNNQKVSPKAKFQQMDAAQNKQNGVGPAVKPSFRATGNVMRSASDIKDMLLQWCKSKTREYQSIEITNFSTSWNDGMAFCALIHHFYPDAFVFENLNPKNRRYNFDLAFKVAEEKADIAPLLDVEDMVLMKKPDWKCVFTYVQSFYRKLHNAD